VLKIIIIIIISSSSSSGSGSARVGGSIILFSSWDGLISLVHAFSALNLSDITPKIHTVAIF
jgi:hypothetical protein